MADLICSAAPADLRAEFAAVVEDLLKLPEPVPYLWGGFVSVKLGLDCSGLICWGCRRVSVPLPLGRPNTDTLWDRCEHVDSGLEEPGDLALYGTGAVRDPACHVMVRIGNGRVAGMSGGDSTCTSISISRAKKPPAQLRAFSSHLYRKDFIGWVRLPFHLAEGAVA